MKKYFTACCLLPALLLGGAPALAASDWLIEGARLCTRHLPESEKRYGIPPNLLAAISSTESGRWHNRLNIALPWPWTINVEGQGYYFDSKQEAIAAVRKYQARGIKSIDVGCMQVNLVHHPNAFASLNEAFDPPSNIDYAARFLRSNYDEVRSWRKAAANYHSRTPARGNQYVGLVHRAWQRIVDRVKGIKGTTPRSYAAKPETAVSPSGKLLTRDRETGKMLPRQKTPSEFSLSVRNLSPAERSREGGVTVIRPTPAPIPEATAEPTIQQAATAPAATATAAVAPATADALPPAPPPSEAVTTETIVQPKMLTVNKPAARRNNAATGPRFIFD